MARRPVFFFFFASAFTKGTINRKVCRLTPVSRLNSLDGSCRYYATFRCDEFLLMDWTRVEFRELQEIHWGIECYYRALKQLCGLSKFQVRKTQSIITHIFCSLIPNPIVKVDL